MLFQYTAFISYKHADYSRKHAVALERAIKNFAKPLFSLPEKIFRDEKYLVPTNDLPKAIKTALQKSDTFILIADKESAKSQWCHDEILYWCDELKRNEQLIIVLIDGQISINKEKKILWEQTDALPELLKMYISFVPFYIDLRWALKTQDRDLLNPNYKNCITSIIGKIKNKTPEELTDEDVKISKRNKRLRIYSITVILILLIAAIFFAIFANYQRREALKNYAQSLSSLSDVQCSIDPTLAFGIAKKGYELDKNSPKIYFSLFNAGQKIHYSELIGLEKYIKYSELSPDGKKVLIIDIDGEAIILDLSTRVITKLDQPGIISKAIFSPDGSGFATASYNGSVVLWDTYSLKSKKLKDHRSLVFELKFSNNGKKLLSESNDGTIRIFDIENKSTIEFKMKDDFSSSVGFSPGDSLILATYLNEGMLRLININNGQEQIKKIADRIQHGCFSANGKMIYACSGDGYIYSWLLKEDKIKKIFHSSSPINNVFVNKKNQLFASCENGILFFPDEAMTNVQEIKSPLGGALECDLSADGKNLITGDSNGNILCWDLENSSYRELKGHTDGISSLRFCGNNIISSSYDRSIRVWKLPIAGTRSIETNVLYASFFQDKNMIITSARDSLVRIINLENNKTQVLDSIKGIFFILRWSPDGEKVVLLNKDIEILVDLKAFVIEYSRKLTDNIWSVEFSPDGKSLLTTNEDSTATLWNIKDHSSRILPGNKSWITNAFFSPDGLRAVVVSDNYAKVWNLLTFSFQEIEYIGCKINRMVFSPDSKEMVIALSDSTIRIWNLPENKFSFFKEKNVQVDNAFFSEDEKLLISTDEANYIKIRDLENKTERSIPSKIGALGLIKFWPEKNYLFMEAGRKLFLIDLNTNNSIILNDERTWLENLYLSKDKTQLIGIYNNKIMIWYLDPQTILARSEKESCTWQLDSIARKKYGIE